MVEVAIVGINGGRRPKKHNGLCRVPVKGDAILPAMVTAWETVLNECEDGLGNPADLYLDSVFLNAILHGITVWVDRMEPTMFPEYQFAYVQVEGQWVDFDGDLWEIGPEDG